MFLPASALGLFRLPDPMFGCESCFYIELDDSDIVWLGEFGIVKVFPVFTVLVYFVWYTSNVFVIFPESTEFIIIAPFD